MRGQRGLESVLVKNTLGAWIGRAVRRQGN